MASSLDVVEDPDNDVAHTLLLLRPGRQLVMTAKEAMDSVQASNCKVEAAQRSFEGLAAMMSSGWHCQHDGLEVALGAAAESIRQFRSSELARVECKTISDRLAPILKSLFVWLLAWSRDCILRCCDATHWPEQELSNAKRVIAVCRNLAQDAACVKFLELSGTPDIVDAIHVQAFNSALHFSTKSSKLRRSTELARAITCRTTMRPSCRGSSPMTCRARHGLT